MNRTLMSISVLCVVGACSDVTPPARHSIDRHEATSAKVTASAIPVTSTIFDADALGGFGDTRSDDYNATAQASYVTTGTNTRGYTSQIGVNGAWRLFLGNQTVRTIYLRLGSQGMTSPTGAIIPDGYYAANVEVYSQCYDANGTQVTLPSMALGSTNGNCSFGVDFGVSGTVYKLAMGPQFAGTGRATVTCTVGSAIACTAWSIVPNSNAPNAGVALLNYYTRNGTLTPLATYHNSFRVTATQ